MESVMQKQILSSLQQSIDFSRDAMEKKQATLVSIKRKFDALEYLLPITEEQGYVYVSSKVPPEAIRRIIKHEKPDWRIEVILYEDYQETPPILVFAVPKRQKSELEQGLHILDVSDFIRGLEAN